MIIQFTFKQMKSSRSLIRIAEQKLSHLLRHTRRTPQSVKLTFSRDGKDHKLHAKFVGSDGFDIEAEDRGEDAYYLIDTVGRKLEESVRRHKGRLRSRLHKIRRGANRPMFLAEPVEFIDAEDILALSHKITRPVLAPITISQAS